MAKARRTRSEHNDEKFEAFLRESFANLRREVDAQAGAQPARTNAGKLLKPRGGFSGRRGWTMGIAALVLAAVAVPLLMQLNHQQEQQKSAATAPIADSPAASAQEPAEQSEGAEPYTKEDDSPPRRRPTAKKSHRSVSADSAEEEEAIPAKPGADAALSGPPASKSMPAQLEKERRFEMPAPEPAPAAPAAGNARPGNDAKGAAMDDAAPAESSGSRTVPPLLLNQRSAPINDSQFRLKQKEIAGAEKAEMETLWKDFERDPEKFLQDQKRTARLKLLLSRHDTKSRSKKLQLAEAQLAK